MGQWFEICILLASSLRMLRFLIPFWKEKLVYSASSNLWLCLCHPVKKLCHSFKLCCLKGSSVFTKQMKWLLIQISPRYIKTRASNKSASDKSMTQKKKKKNKPSWFWNFTLLLSHAWLKVSELAFGCTVQSLLSAQGCDMIIFC